MRAHLLQSRARLSQPAGHPVVMSADMKGRGLCSLKTRGHWLMMMKRPQNAAKRQEAQ
jgi:ATP-dependent Clp protease adapter protein ClpS